MKDYQGVIIEESLADKGVLKDVKILSTEAEKVTEEHQTPWLRQWTMHTVAIPESEASEMAQKISQSLESEHAWYADFKNDTHHYIIFRGQVFQVDRQSQAQYDAAKNFGLSLGIPEYQVDFQPDTKEWERPVAG